MDGKLHVFDGTGPACAGTPYPLCERLDYASVERTAWVAASTFSREATVSS